MSIAGTLRAVGMRPGVTATEIADIARAQVGVAWEGFACTSFVWGVSNLAGARLFDLDGANLSNNDPLTPITVGDGSASNPFNYSVPSNNAGPGFSHENELDLWTNVLAEENASWSTMVDTLQAGDAVRIDGDGASGWKHSFIVSRIDSDGQIWIIDNGGPVVESGFSRSIVERRVEELSSFFSV